MNAFLMAWRVSKRLPTPVVRAGVGAFAWSAWLMRAKPVRRLEGNLHRVTGAQGRALRKLSRQGLASAGRYYAEILELPRMSGSAIDARVRLANPERVRDVLDTEGRLVVALSHSGNWDLIGAYSCRNLKPVTSVAEKLKPPEMFDEFVRLREDLGMTIFGHEGSSTFRRMISAARSSGGVLALVADRDMSGTGVETQMWGHGVRVAPGPAALAAATDSALFGMMIHYERLTGKRRRQAGTRWGIVATFSDEIRATGATGREQVASMTQAWVQFMADGIEAHPQDWHMLQRFGWTQ